jgi:ubiquinone/menaquinone biosynthesis C-methylase UbiE
MSKSQLDYEEIIFGSRGGKLVSFSELAVILEYLKPRSFDRILDVGTGTGRVAREIILTSGASVVGIDINRLNIKVAVRKKKMLKEHEDKYDLIIADGQYLPFKDSSFDSVICIRAIKYFPDYCIGIMEMTRTLKTYGKLVLTISNLFSIDLILIKLKILAYNRLFNFRRIAYFFKRYDLVVASYKGLHKIHPKIWTVSNNQYFLAFLKAAESVLQKLTPKEALSREILVKFIKIKSR